MATQLGYHCEVRPWFDCFPAGTPDIEWLPVVGAKRWIVLTKDANIRRRAIEIEAYLNARVRAFVLTASDLRREEQAALLIQVLPKIGRICHRSGPFIYNITRSGQLFEISNRALRRRLKRARGRPSR